MKYPTKTDPVVIDELAYDRQCEANEYRMDRCREAARFEYENGDLDSQILEWLVENSPDDLAKVALAVVTGIDTDDMDLWLSRESISISSIRGTIEDVIEDRAEQMYDSGENY